MTVIPLRLCFKGERTYLHATDLYEALVGAVQSEFGIQIDGFQMSIRRFFSRQPDLYWTDSPGESARPVNAVGEWSVAGQGQELRGWVVESGRPVDCRLPFDEDRIARHASIQGKTALIDGPLEFLPIELIISMTKHLHDSLLPACGRRWVFTKLDLRRLLRPVDSARLQITLEETLHGRLTRSQIAVAGEPVGKLFFSQAAL